MEAGGEGVWKQKQRAMWQGVHKLLLSLPLVGGNLACYVTCLPGCAHTHMQARHPPANQGASSVAWAPLFCSSSRNKIRTVCRRLTLQRRTRHKEGRGWGWGGCWAVGQERHNTLCHSCYSTWRPVAMAIEPKTTLLRKKTVRVYCMALPYKAQCVLMVIFFIPPVGFLSVIVFMMDGFVFLSCIKNFLLWGKYRPDPSFFLFLFSKRLLQKHQMAFSVAPVVWNSWCWESYKINNDLRFMAIFTSSMIQWSRELSILDDLIWPLHCRCVVSTCDQQVLSVEIRTFQGQKGKIQEW